MLCEFLFGLFLPAVIRLRENNLMKPTKLNVTNAGIHISVVSRPKFLCFQLVFFFLAPQRISPLNLWFNAHDEYSLSHVTLIAVRMYSQGRPYAHSWLRKLLSSHTHSAAEYNKKINRRESQSSIHSKCLVYIIESILQLGPRAYKGSVWLNSKSK